MSFLFALFSTILLLPVLIFIKSGLSIKGKLLIVFISFSIAALGLLALWTYPLWQSALIMLVMVMITTYLLNGKYQHVVFELETKEITIQNKELTFILEEEVEEEFLIEVHNVEVSSVKEKFEVSKEDLVAIELTEAAEHEAAVGLYESETVEHEATVAHQENKTAEKAMEPALDMKEENDTDAIEKLIAELLLDSEKAQNQVLIEPKDILIDGQPMNMVEELPIESEEFEQVEEHPYLVTSDIEDEEETINIVFPIYGDELEEIDPRHLSEKKEVEEVFIELEEEITPLKMFGTISKVDTSNQETELTKIEKNSPIKKETYLAEIEKLLEED